jgi:hypothetical protein
MSMETILPEAKLAEIAAEFGLSPDSKMVRENAAQAVAYHGTKCEQFDGNMERFWGCNYLGNWDAERLLRGYLQEETRVNEADARSYDDFHRNAYGED